MKKRVYISVFFLCACTCLSHTSAQNSEIDSLTRLVKTSAEDTNKINALNQLAFQFIGVSRFDTAIVCGNTALTLSEKLDYKTGLSPSLTNIGIGHHNYGNFPKALEYYLKALKHDEMLGNKLRIGKSLSNIGVVYLKQKELNKALEYFSRSLKFMEEVENKKGIAAVTNNIGNIYNQRKDYKTALTYYHKALELDKETASKHVLSIRVGALGIVYHELHDFEKAEYYYREALRYSEQSGNEEARGRYLCNIGSVYSDRKQFKQAEPYILQSLAIFEKIGFLEGLVEANEQLSIMYEGMGNYVRSLEHFKRSSQAKDSLFNEEKNNEVVRHELNYEFEKKEAAYNAEQDKKAAVAESERKKQRLLLLLIICITLAVSITALIVFRSLSTTRKQKKIIEDQKIQVEEKQKEILDSIHYAKKIQRVLMPSEGYIAKSLKRLKH